MATDDEERLLKLLYPRTLNQWDEAKAFEGIADLVLELGKDERGEFEKEQKRAAGMAAEQKEFKKHYKARRKAHTERRIATFIEEGKPVGGKGGKGKKGKGGGGKGLRTADDYWQKVYENVAKYLPVGDAVEQKTLAGICPPGGSVWRDWKRARWNGHFEANHRFGVPWSDGGYEEAGYEVVRELWRQHADFLSLELACPVDGLFPKGDCPAAKP